MSIPEQRAQHHDLYKDETQLNTLRNTWRKSRQKETNRGEIETCNRDAGRQRWQTVKE